MYVRLLKWDVKQDVKSCQKLKLIQDVGRTKSYISQARVENFVQPRWVGQVGWHGGELLC